MTALAEKIKPEVEKTTGLQVSTNTVLVALKRLADRLIKENEAMYLVDEIPHDIKISLTDSIIDLDLDNIQFEEISGVFDKLLYDKKFTFHLFNTSKHCRVFTEQLDIFEKLFTRQFGPKEKQFSKVTLNFSINHKERVLNNLLIKVSYILYNSHVNIHSAFFTSSEITLIVEDSDAIRLYDTLYNHLLKTKTV